MKPTTSVTVAVGLALVLYFFAEGRVGSGREEVGLLFDLVAL